MLLLSVLVNVPSLLILGFWLWLSDDSKSVIHQLFNLIFLEISYFFFRRYWLAIVIWNWPFPILLLILWLVSPFFSVIVWFSFSFAAISLSLRVLSLFIFAFVILFLGCLSGLSSFFLLILRFFFGFWHDFVDMRNCGLNFWDNFGFDFSYNWSNFDLLYFNSLLNWWPKYGASYSFWYFSILNLCDVNLFMNFASILLYKFGQKLL